MNYKDFILDFVLAVIIAAVAFGLFMYEFGLF